ncbi:hypothetical protein K432DRAFT_430686, partial [Lepidopterella palustris CBS 459.81]
MICPTFWPCRQSTKFQVMSDLHLETIQYEFDIPKSAPNLILAGDIGRLSDIDRYAAFLSKCQQFERILLVPGNHEFYGSSREQGIKLAKRLEDGIPNLTIMNRKRVDIGNITILGCTLHSRISSNARKTMDFSRIFGWTVQNHNEEHDRDVSWLKNAVELISVKNPAQRIIVVTHYAPSFEKTCHPD